MKIDFCIPFAFSAGSNPSDTLRVENILQESLNAIRERSTRGSAKATLRNGPKRNRVSFDLPHVFHSRSNAVDNAKVLETLLCCLRDLDVVYLEEHPNTPPLYESGVVYDRTQVWDTTPALYRRGFGDCKSLTCALLAEYKIRGIWAKPVFRWMVDQKGQTNYHILVQTDRGFEDPSKILGMGRDENAYFAQRMAG